VGLPVAAVCSHCTTEQTRRGCDLVVRSGSSWYAEITISGFPTTTEPYSLSQIMPVGP